MRDIQEVAHEGALILEAREYLDLRFNDLAQFAALFDELAGKGGVHDALFDIVAVAYKMGLAIGMRNGQE